MYTENIIEILEILDNEVVQIKHVTQIIKDGEIVATKNHRSVAYPGDDISAKSEKLKKIANVLWTPEIIDEFKKTRITGKKNV